VLSAVLLTSREPLSIFRLAQICDATQHAVREGLDMLEAEFRRSGLPLTVARTDDTIRVLTLPEVAPYLERSRGIKKAERLSPAALETLAVVAYRQPVMRVEIEAIRGVKVGPMLRTLLEHKLVTIVGRADVPGRPLQYGTTQQFLDRFGLASLKDLPSLKEAKSLG
jgi:segregation and condensation protein B